MKKHGTLGKIKPTERSEIKILAGLLSIIVITLLLLSGPIEAYQLSLELDDSSIVKGDEVTFTTGIKINSNEIIGIDYFSLELDGPTNKACKFNIDGSIKSGCSGITIEKLDTDEPTETSEGYGYGYYSGYTNGELKYKITLDSGSYSKGTYLTKLKVITKDLTYIEIKGEDLEIRSGYLHYGTNSMNVYDDEAYKHVIVLTAPGYANYSKITLSENQQYKQEAKKSNAIVYGSFDDGIVYIMFSVILLLLIVLLIIIIALISKKRKRAVRKKAPKKENVKSWSPI